MHVILALFFRFCFLISLKTKFYRLFIYVLPLEIQLSTEEG